jgi:hypothetical protein
MVPLYLRRVLRGIVILGETFNLVHTNADEMHRASFEPKEHQLSLVQVPKESPCHDDVVTNS